MATSDEKLTLAEKLSFFWALASIALSVPFVALRHTVLPPVDSQGVHRAAVSMLLRSITSIPSKQQRVMIPQPSTGETIEAFCRKHKRLNLYLTVRNCIGSDPYLLKATEFFFFFTEAATTFQLAMLIRHLLRSVHRIRQLLLPCWSIPLPKNSNASYPMQLKQTIEALKHILTITSPSKANIAGDSVGGHLAASLFSHLIHPSKDLESIKLPEKLSGICFISPFLSFDLDKASYRENEKHDYLTM